MSEQSAAEKLKTLLVELGSSWGADVVSALQDQIAECKDNIRKICEARDKEFGIRDERLKQAMAREKAAQEQGNKRERELLDAAKKAETDHAAALKIVTDERNHWKAEHDRLESHPEIRAKKAEQLRQEIAAKAALLAELEPKAEPAKPANVQDAQKDERPTSDDGMREGE